MLKKNRGKNGKLTSELLATHHFFSSQDCYVLSCFLCLFRNKLEAAHGFMKLTSSDKINKTEKFYVFLFKHISRCSFKLRHRHTCFKRYNCLDKNWYFIASDKLNRCNTFVAILYRMTYACKSANVYVLTLKPCLPVTLANWPFTVAYV